MLNCYIFVCRLPFHVSRAQLVTHHLIKQTDMSISKRKASALLRRRSFIRMGASSAAAIFAGPSFNLISSSIDKKNFPYSLHTPLCDLLRIKFPIIQSGMGSVATPELAAKVSEAGGLGIIGATLIPPDELRRRIKRVRELTKKPFGVNFLLHEGIISPIDTRKIPDSLVLQVQQMLNSFRNRL